MQYYGSVCAIRRPRVSVTTLRTCCALLPHTVSSFLVARFKIGHTPRKFPDIPSATFRFNAYRSVQLPLNLHNYTTGFCGLQAFFRIFRPLNCKFFVNTHFPCFSRRNGGCFCAYQRKNGLYRSAGSIKSACIMSFQREWIQSFGTGLPSVRAHWRQRDYRAPVQDGMRP